MKIYLINPRKDFSEKQLKILDDFNVIFINHISELMTAKDIFSNEEKIIAISPDYTNWEFKNEIIEKIPNIKAICLGTTAYHYIDLPYCISKNILVTNIKNYATESVAEYLMFYAMSLAKKLPLQIKNENRQDFLNEYMQILLTNKTAGIIGLGNIGSKVASLCESINMKVIYWSANSRNKQYQYISLEELFQKSDFIFLTLSVNDETKKIITDDLLNKMNLNACFISATGPALYNHNFLLNKISEGKLFGYALEEPNKNIFDYKGNVMVTSEYAWYTCEAAEKRMNIWIDCIRGIVENNFINLITR